ncbi:MAG: hypothetical protein ABMB14_03570 [Myxococcota bacterium]
MRSGLADPLRDEQRSREAAMTPGDRVRLALQLGARDGTCGTRRRAVTLREAYRELRRAEQDERRPRRWTRWPARALEHRDARSSPGLAIELGVEDLLDLAIAGGALDS